jgi:arylsulfatase A-like enzyme
VPPNVVLIVLDTARADVFEPYGASAGSSPAIAQLASRGTAFRDAIAPCCWTMPSHAAMFTGLLPRTIGLAHPPGDGLHSTRPVMEANRPRLLPEVLRSSGFATSAVSANPWISPASGFDTGFDQFVEVRSGRAHDGPDTWRGKGRVWLEAALARADDGAAEADDVIARWLAGAPAQPFFWFVNLIECHSPYLPPRPYTDLSLTERIRAARANQRHLTLGEIWRVSAGGWDLPDAVVERMRYLYQRSIRQLDDWVARLLARLDGAGLLDDTLVIVTSDHGENLGEGQLIGHCFSLDNRLIKVPLVMAGPGCASDGGVISLTSIPALIAGAVGMAEHPWEEATQPDGVAVAQYDELVSPGDPRGPEAVASWGLDNRSLRVLTTPMTAATDGRTKLVRFGFEERVYDLMADPLEARPLAPGHVNGHMATALPNLRAAIEGSRRDEIDDDVLATIMASANGNGGRASSGGEEDLEARLRLLGYL